jgi:hypothetical protein
VTAVRRFKASYPDRAFPKFNGLVIDKRFRPRFGLPHVAKQVYLANDVAIIPQDVHFERQHLQPPCTPLAHRIYGVPIRGRHCISERTP